MSVVKDGTAKMKLYTFRFCKTRRTSDNQEGIVLFGSDPDHLTPLTVINAFLGKTVLELNGRGMGVNLFLPESHLDDWQKLALCKKAWVDVKTNKDEQVATLDLDVLRRLTI